MTHVRGSLRDGPGNQYLFIGSQMTYLGKLAPELSQHIVKGFLTRE